MICFLNTKAELVIVLLNGFSLIVYMTDFENLQICKWSTTLFFFNFKTQYNDSTYVDN